MTLEQLLEGLEYKTAMPLDKQVSAVVTDSRKVAEGAVFVCIKGRKVDGHDLATQALEKGAVAVVCDRSLDLENEIVVEHTRYANARLCQNFFGNPQKDLTLVAVTGTNGKTTVTSVVKQALESLGVRAGLIGTIHCEIADMIVPAKFTTPEPWDLCALFARMRDAGCTHVVMEASSQALDQGRLLGLRFAVCVFTNLTQDHLDYHGDMQTYFEAKTLLFGMGDASVINGDDPYGQKLSAQLNEKAMCFSVKNAEDVDITAENVEYSISGAEFDLRLLGETHRVRFPMPGAYSVANALSAAGVLHALGYPIEEIAKALSATRGVKGRCEVLHAGEVTVICDFAHTGDGLQQLLSSLRPFVKGRLVVLFGCAGDRDPIKRPAMAKAVCDHADFVVLTSDNPRTEDPLSIINEVRPLIEASGVPFTAEPDRLLAIRWALRSLQAEDVLVLCGKGHEDYQVIDGCTIYLDEHRIVREYFENEPVKEWER